jgi:type 1 fimbria pilin
MRLPAPVVLSLLLIGGTLFMPRAQAEPDCEFGAVPFEFGSVDPVEASLDADILTRTPLNGVISGLEYAEPTMELGVSDVTCIVYHSGSIPLPLTNLALPPVIGSTSYNGRTYDIYPTSEAWAGFIIVRRNGDFQEGATVVMSKRPGTTSPQVDLHLRLKFVKLADPLTGTVGEFVTRINASQLPFSLMLPDNRLSSQVAQPSAMSVYILGVVCNLLAPHLMDFGQIPIADLRIPGKVLAQPLVLQLNCGAGNQMINPRVPDSMQVTFTGGAGGFLDTTQANVRFGIVDRLGGSLRFNAPIPLAPLTNTGSLTASNTVRLSVRPQLRSLTGEVTPGLVTGNLGIQVIYK